MKAKWHDRRACCQTAGMVVVAVAALGLAIRAEFDTKENPRRGGPAKAGRAPIHARPVLDHRAAGGPFIDIVPPVHAYRPQVAAERTGKTLSLLTIRGLDERSAGMIAARSGGPGPDECELDEECDACDPCLVGECVAGDSVVSNTVACAVCDDGVFCNGLEMCDVIMGWPSRRTPRKFE